MTILVTGSKGMIGSHLVRELLAAGHEVIGVDRSEKHSNVERYASYSVDLGDLEGLREIVHHSRIDRVIHLAALAHTSEEDDLSWERYYQINVVCAKNVFAAAFGEKIPVLFISTVDVYGFTDGVVDSQTPPRPVTNYGKSKFQAEKELATLAVATSAKYTIFRFSPVYTEEIKRDIQKRYYLKYPNIAYQIGKGTEYEILNVKRAVQSMVDWCNEIPQNSIRIIKDSEPMWTPDYIRKEKNDGRAKIVLRFPEWVVNFGYIVLKFVFGENEKIYLLNKAVHPLKTV